MVVPLDKKTFDWSPVGPVSLTINENILCFD